MSWTACYTAVDFCARLAFCKSFRLALQSTARSLYIHETYIHYKYEKIRTSRILYQESRFIVRIFL